MTDLDRQLRAFAAHLRDPTASAPPAGIEDRRLAIYRDLLANNIHSLLSGNFPVMRKTLGEARWRTLVARFFADHPSRTPLFTRVASEFVDYLQLRDDAGDPPWLAELAHYEWMELALQIDDAPVPAHDADGDLRSGMPLVSPHAWALAYRWPVHRIGPACQPPEPGATHTLLLLRREPDGSVHFFELSPLVYRLLELLDTNDGNSGEVVLEQLASEADAAEREVFMGEGLAMLERLRDEGTILGTTP